MHPIVGQIILIIFYGFDQKIQVIMHINANRFSKNDSISTSIFTSLCFLNFDLKISIINLPEIQNVITDQTTNENPSHVGMAIMVPITNAIGTTMVNRHNCNNTVEIIIFMGF